MPVGCRRLCKSDRQERKSHPTCIWPSQSPAPVNTWPVSLKRKTLPPSIPIRTLLSLNTAGLESLKTTGRLSRSCARNSLPYKTPKHEPRRCDAPDLLEHLSYLGDVRSVAACARDLRLRLLPASLEMATRCSCCLL